MLVNNRKAMIRQCEMTPPETCEHLVMSRCGKICGNKAKLRATLPDGKTMVVCGRHANTLCVANFNRVVFADLP